MKIVIAGGSGQVGSVLARHFHAKGDEVVILSRSPKDTPWKTAIWDAQSRGEWIKELEGAGVLINLTGRIVNCRYNYKHRCEIWSSRARSVRVLGEVVNELQSPPKLWLQASTATIYAHSFDKANDEYTGIIGGTEKDSPEKWRFSIDVARAWEGEFSLVSTPKTRKVALRSAMVMSYDKDSIFDYLLWLVRLGLGGTAGHGKQYISWIHYLDFISSLEFIINNAHIEGAVNICSPNPLPNKAFMKILRQAWGQKIGLPAFEWMLEIGAIFLKTETELILKSRRVMPTRLLNEGFAFSFPDWKEASKDLCQKWKETNDPQSPKNP